MNCPSIQKRFTPEKCKNDPCTTFQRDTDIVAVPLGTEGLLPWAMAIPADLSENYLMALKLKWLMDVDEMFYVGDESVPVKGLINGGYESGGKAPDTVLVTPIAFAKAAIAGESAGHPCKWLQLVNEERFEYCRASVIFKLAWPQRVILDGVEVFAGGIFPISSEA